jgi:hypothetical protein
VVLATVWERLDAIGPQRHDGPPGIAIKRLGDRHPTDRSRRYESAAAGEQPTGTQGQQA